MIKWSIPLTNRYEHLLASYSMIDVSSFSFICINELNFIIIVYLSVA